MHLEIPVNIFSAFIQALGENIAGANFNKYYEPPKIPHPLISVRFSFKEEREDIVKRIALRVANDLLNNGQIRYHDNDLREWTEPNFVAVAHELGTARALDLKTWMVQNQDIYQHYQVDSIKKAGFMAQLIHLTFRQVGFGVPFVWGFLRESPLYNKDELKDEERVVDLSRIMARKLEEKMKEVDKEIIPDFLERAVHALFNCTLTRADITDPRGLSTEMRVLSWLDNSLRWKQIAKEFKK